MSTSPTSPPVAAAEDVPVLDILRMDVGKDLLRKMAKEERCLFLALGHASNQVNALWKLVIVLTNGDEADPVKQKLEGAQTQIFARLDVAEDLALLSILGRDDLGAKADRAWPAAR